MHESVCVYLNCEYIRVIGKYYRLEANEGEEMEWRILREPMALLCELNGCIFDNFALAFIHPCTSYIYMDI